MSGFSRVGYDARLAIEPYRGMGRYLRALIRGKESEFVGFCATGESSPTLQLEKGGARFYPLWEQLSLPRQLSKYDINIFIAPFNTAPLRLSSTVQLVQVIHDLIFLDPLPWSRSLYQNFGRIYRRIVVPRAAARANVIITVSEYSKAQILDRLRVPASRVEVIPCSLPEGWFHSMYSRHDQPPYVLMVSGEAPSKNLRRGIAGFSKVASLKYNLQLKIVGVKENYHHEFMQFARECGIGDRVKFQGFQREEQLKDLYRGAEVFVLPSLAEGFGIPLLEAMASNVPIASSSATSLPEVAGNAALYFDPFSEEEVAARLTAILESPGTRQRLVEEGHRQVLQYHEARVAEKIQAFWSRLESDCKQESSSS